MSESKPIRVLIADDHPVVREGLVAMFGNLRDFELVGAVQDGVEAVELARALKPDVILMDLVMPRQDGIQSIVEIKRDDPEARILVVTTFEGDDQVFPAIKAGALGYVLKDALPETLIQAVRDVYRGETSIHPTIARRLVQEIQQPPSLPPTREPLTEREVDVLKLIARGLTNQEIAERLIIGERTVRFHVSNILSKLHLANRVQAALYAFQEGLAGSED